MTGTAAAQGAGTTYTVCYKQGSELDLDLDLTPYALPGANSNTRQKLANSNYFGPTGTAAPETLAFTAIPSISEAALVAQSCDIWIGGGVSSDLLGGTILTAAETTEIKNWSNNNDKFVIAGCDYDINTSCSTFGRSLTAIINGGVSINSALSYNPLSCGGALGVATFGGASTVISTLPSDSVLATHDATGQPAAITDSLTNPRFLMTADADMYGVSGAAAIQSGPIASSDQARLVVNTFKFAADALSGRLANPQCLASYDNKVDLAINVSVDNSAPTEDDTVTFDLTVTNQSGPAAGFVTVTAPLPAGFIYISDSSGGQVAAPIDYDPVTGVWAVGTVLPGQMKTITVNAQASGPGGIFYGQITNSNYADTDSAPNVDAGGLEDDEASVSVAISPKYITISGAIFLDNGKGAGASPHNGTLESDEAGLGGIAVEAFDSSGNSVAVTTSSGDGSYTLDLPVTQAGSPVLIQVVAPDGTRHISGAVLNATDIDMSDGEVSFAPTLSTPYQFDFGLVPEPRLIEGRTQSLTSGLSTTFAHSFTVGTPMNVNFTLTNVMESSPGAITTFLYLDTNCDGNLSTGETSVTNPYAAAAEDEICLVVRATASAGAPSGSSVSFDVTATGTYVDSAATFALTNSDTVIVKTGGSLTLSKQVCNASTSTCDAATGAGFGLSNSGAPGDTLVYRIAFTNTGSAANDNVAIADTTPPYSALTATAPAVEVAPAGVTCTLTVPAAPAAGYAGTVAWDCPGAMAPGAAGAVSFEVKIKD